MMNPMWRIAGCSATILSVACLSALADVGHVPPGQWALGDFQQICLTKDGKWYGTTFNFSGTTADLIFPDISAGLTGNYKVHTASGVMHANDTITVLKGGTVFDVYWYDWYDDLSYANVVFAEFDFIKSDCDPPFTRRNTHAATQ